MKRNLGVIVWLAMLSLAGVAVGLAQEKPPTTTNTPPAVSAGPKDLLEFLNGDLLRGTFLSLDAKSGVRWQHVSIKQVLSVNPPGIAKIRLQRPKLGKVPAHNCSVRLVNNDELIGDLVGLDGEKLTLETWYAGTLKLPRNSLQSMAVGMGRYRTIYEGPTGVEGWTLRGSGAFGGRVVIDGVMQVRPATQTAWQFKDEAFYGYSPGSIGRDVKLPPASNIEFDLSWQGYPQLSLFFYTDYLEGYGGNAYVMQLSYRNVYLRRQSQSGGSSNLGNTELPTFAQKTKARISLRTDREQKSIALLIDDTLVKQWSDNVDLQGTGTGILFYQQGQQPLKISNIRITEWDGRLEEPAGPPPNAKEDLVRLVNKDKISGTLKTIQDGKLSFGTAFATLEVPLERVTRIDFAAEKAAPAPLGTNEVRLVFAERGKVTLQVERWDEQQVVGRSPNLGQVKLMPVAFSIIQFNLDKQKVDTDALDAATGGGMPPQMWIE